MNYPKRKTIRLKGYDYNTPRYYFITVCTHDKQKMLCDIVGTGVLDGPQIKYTHYGEIAQKHLQAMGDFYDEIKVDKYVIMPNHIHLIISILGDVHGPSGRPVPTDSKIARFIGTFKRFCNKECGTNIWQTRSYDHIIRGEKDYQKIWAYIDGNPSKWADDCFYVE